MSARACERLRSAAVELAPVETRHVAGDVDHAAVRLDQHPHRLDALELDEDRAGTRGRADGEAVLLELLDDLALFVGLFGHSLGFAPRASQALGGLPW